MFCRTPTTPRRHFYWYIGNRTRASFWGATSNISRRPYYINFKFNRHQRAVRQSAYHLMYVVTWGFDSRVTVNLWDDHSVAGFYRGLAIHPIPLSASRHGLRRTLTLGTLDHNRCGSFTQGGVSGWRIRSYIAPMGEPEEMVRHNSLYAKELIGNDSL